MTKPLPGLFFFTYFLLFFSTMLGQQKNESERYKWFDETIGTENSILFNGTRPSENTRSKDGSHKYYLSSSFVPGNIVYQSQPFFDIPLKYDIHKDELIINLTADTKTSIIKLIKTNVQQFTLQNKQFVQLQVPEQTMLVSGFYEVLFQSDDLSLYKKHHKTKKERIVHKEVYTDYRENDEYLIQERGEYEMILNKNDLISAIPEHKTTINNFYKENDQLRKSDFDAFLIKLSKYLSGLK